MPHHTQLSWLPISKGLDWAYINPDYVTKGTGRTGIGGKGWRVSVYKAQKHQKEIASRSAPGPKAALETFNGVNAGLG